MKTNSVVKIASIVAFLVAAILFVNLVITSKATSYLSSDPKACINCHVMNTQYATWQHSSHARAAVCIECHLPREGFFEKYLAKARDGWNHTVAFTFNTYDHAMKISEDGARRVQNNCISCHKSMASKITDTADQYHNFSDPNIKNGRRCWSCHTEVPHGKVRGLTTTPHNLGIKEVE